MTKNLKKVACAAMAALMIAGTSFNSFENTAFDVFDYSISTYAASARKFNQNDSKWDEKKYSDGTTLRDAGCGIFSFGNALYSLNGTVIDPQAIADYVYSSYWDNRGVLDKSIFYNKLEAKYGSAYNFQISGDKSGKWADVSDSSLINHLKNGGVAVAHVYKHFIAIDGYNTSTKKYHVIDSYVTNERGLPDSGWVTASKLTNVSAKTKVDWFVLISKRSNSTTLKISPVSYPTSIKKGSSFNLTGTVTSNYKITQFKGEILQGSTVKQTYTVKPNTTSVNIQSSAVNTNLKFNKLAAGSYTLKYTAKDSSGKTKTWSKNFTVTAPTASTLAINPTAYPTSIKKSSSYNLKGTITSNYKITQFKGEILQGSTVKQTYTVKPNTTSVNIQSSAVNTNLKFNKLAAGSYTLKYTAKDSSGKTKTWSKNFTVTAPAASTLTINPTVYPTSIKKGASFNLKGKVTSNYNITQFKGEIIQGSTVKQSYTTNPNAAYVDIQSNAVNSNLKFGKLAKGTYTLRYTAKDSSGKTKTWSKTFKIV